jgi:hypothetical protein
VRWEKPAPHYVSVRADQHQHYGPLLMPFMLGVPLLPWRSPYWQ